MFAFFLNVIYVLFQTMKQATVTQVKNELKKLVPR